MPFAITTIQGSTTASFGVDMYLVDASGGSLTVTLPVTTGNQGNTLQFKRIDWVSSNTVTIVPDSTDGSFIDGTLSSALMNPGNCMFLFVDSNQSWQNNFMDLTSNFAFGDGGDGVVQITANTTLTRDMYYQQLDVGNGAVVTTNGFRIFVADRLTMTGNATSIQSNGASAVGGTGGAGAGGTTPGNLVSSVGGGFAGPHGVIGLLTPGAGGSPNIAQPCSIGGTGGAGGAVGATAGGAGGQNTPPGVSCGGTSCVAQQQNAVTARDYSALPLSGGSSGGSGASGSLTATSGGAGGSAGIVVICARSFLCDVNQACTIQAIGGNGGNASGTGNAGGGGGGAGGGVIILTRVSNILANSPGLTVSVAGGAGGLGTGTGANGSAGSAGTLKVIDHL